MDAGVDAGMDYHDAYYAAQDTYLAAKELAESYRDLQMEITQYEAKMGCYSHCAFPHYTLDDAYYLLTQGAHEQAERVQTSGPSDPILRAVINAESLQHRLNAEMDEEYRKEVVEPYNRICEKLHLFDLCMSVLGKRQYRIAEQLYIIGVPQRYVADENGRRIGRKRLEEEIEGILRQFAEVILDYREYKKSI